MNVTLPNGQTISNVPEGTTKAQLVDKLQRNGHDTSWYTPATQAEPTVHDAYNEAQSESTTGLKAGSNIVRDIGLAVPAGLYGLAEGARGLVQGHPDPLGTAVEGIESAYGAYEDLPKFRGQEVASMEQTGKEGLDKLATYPGELAEKGTTYGGMAMTGFHGELEGKGKEQIAGEQETIRQTGHPASRLSGEMFGEMFVDPGALYAAAKAGGMAVRSMRGRGRPSITDEPIPPDVQDVIVRAQMLADKEGVELSADHVKRAEAEVAGAAGESPTVQGELDISQKQVEGYTPDEAQAEARAEAQSELEYLKQSEQFRREYETGTRDLFDPHTSELEARTDPRQPSAREGVAEEIINDPRTTSQYSPDESPTGVPPVMRDYPALEPQGGKRFVGEPIRPTETRPGLDLDPDLLSDEVQASSTPTPKAGDMLGQKAVRGTQARWHEGQEYEGRLFGGAYNGARLRFAAKDAPIRDIIAQGRVRYNEIRAEFGLKPVTDWAVRPERDQLIQFQPEPSSAVGVINRDYIRNKEVGELVLKNDVRGALNMILDTSISKWNQQLANLLLRDPTFSPKLTMVEQLIATDIKAGGVVDPSAKINAAVDVESGEVFFNRAEAAHELESTILHELIHSKVARLQMLYKGGRALPRDVVTHLENIKRLYHFSQDMVRNDKYVSSQYGFADEYEFIAEAFTNPRFQQVLMDIRVDPSKYRGLVNTVKTAWDAFMVQIKGLLGYRGDTNVLARTLNEGATLFAKIDGSTKIAKIAYGKNAVRWTWELNSDFKEAGLSGQKAEKVDPIDLATYKARMAEKGGKDFANKYGAAMHKAYKENFKRDYGPPPPVAGYDNRPFDVFKGDLVRPDGTQRVDDIHPLGGTGPAYTAAEKHPVISRVYDAISQASNLTDKLFNELWRGATVQRVGDYTLKHPWKTTKWSALDYVGRTENANAVGVLAKNLTDKEFTDIVDIIHKYQEASPESLRNDTVLRANGITPKGRRFLKSLDETNIKALEKINETRKASSLPEIPKNDAWWFTKVRFGPYQVFVIDPKTNKHNYLAAFDNMADAERVAEAVQAENPTWEVFANQKKKNPNNLDYVPGEAFVEAANQLTDPVLRKAMEDAAQVAVNKHGIKKYSLPRDSKAGGHSGSRELINTLGAAKAKESFVKSLEIYYRQVSSYVGGHEAGKKLGAMKMDSDIRKLYPNALNKANYMYSKYRGSEEFLDTQLRELSTVLGTLPVLKNVMGENTLKNMITIGGKVFITSKLVWANPVFYLANAVQHFVIPSRMQQVAANMNWSEGSVTVAMLKAEYHMIAPDNATKNILMTAIDNGSLEARFAEALDWTASTESKVLRGAQLALGAKVAAYADSYSRAIAYLSFYEQGKANGLTDVQAHSFSARESQGTMIQYEKWARMPVLNKLGVAGDAIAPLTTFITNMAYRIADYMKDATLGRNGQRLVAPLLSIMSLQVALSGIRGIPGWEDLNDLTIMLNNWYLEKWGGDPIPTPTRFLTEMGVPSVAMDGVPSWMTGIDMTGTLGMGRIAGNLMQAVGVEHLFDVIGTFYNLAENTMSGRLSRRDMSDTMTKVFPPASKEWIKSLIESTNPMDPSKVRQKTDFIHQRSQGEQYGALLTGKRSLAEAEKSQQKYESSSYEASLRTAETAAVNKFVDTMFTGDSLGNFTEQMFSRNPELFNRLEKAFEARVEKDHIPYAERMRMRSTLSIQKRKLFNRIHDASLHKGK